MASIKPIYYCLFFEEKTCWYKLRCNSRYDVRYDVRFGELKQCLIEFKFLFFWQPKKSWASVLKEVSYWQKLMRVRKKVSRSESNVKLNDPLLLNF